MLQKIPHKLSLLTKVPKKYLGNTFEKGSTTQILNAFNEMEQCSLHQENLPGCWYSAHVATTTLPGKTQGSEGGEDLKLPSSKPQATS